MEVVGLGEGPEDLPSAGHVRVDYEIYAHGLSEELALLHVLGSADPRYGLLAAQILAVEDAELAARLDAKRASDAAGVLVKDRIIMEKLNQNG